MASRRNYLTEDELEEFADITVTDASEAEDQVSQAEELIDQFVGAQDKFFHYILQGKASAGASTSQFTLDSIHKDSYPYTDYFTGLMIEVIGGTNAGQRKRITASSTLGVITTEAFTSAFDTTSVYKIFQLGKFPRVQDVFYNPNETPAKYYKSIPEAVKRAVAAQVEYKISMGDKFFTTDSSERTAERIGDYSYVKRAGVGGSSQLIAPKARILLKGIINRTGDLIVE